MENPIKVTINYSGLDFDRHLLPDTKATVRKAKWTAAGLFQLENGKIKL